MWQRLLNQCHAAAWDQLADEAFVEAACVSAVAAGAAAHAALETCYALLGDVSEDGAWHARSRVAAALVASLARRCAAGEVLTESLAMWASRTDDRRARRVTIPDDTTTWTALDFLEWAYPEEVTPSGTDCDDRLIAVQQLLLPASDLQPLMEDEGRLHAVYNKVVVRPLLGIHRLPTTLPDLTLPVTYRLKHSTLEAADLETLAQLLTAATPRARIGAVLLLDLHEQLNAKHPDWYPPLPPTLPAALFACLNDDSPFVRDRSTALLGRVVRVARLHAKDADHLVQQGYHVVEELSAALVAGLALRLRDPVAGVRLTAAATAAAFGPAAGVPPILAALERLLQEPEEAVVLDGLQAVGALQERVTGPLLGRLNQALGDTSGNVRLGGLSAVQSLGRHAATPEIVATVPKLFRDDAACPDAVRAYASLGVRPDEFILTELGRILYERSSAWDAATQAVAQFGPVAAVPVILDALSRLVERPTPHVGAIAAVGALGPAAYAESVYQALTNPLFTCQALAAEAIAAVRRLGPKGERRLLEDVADRLRHADRRERNAAVQLFRSLRGRTWTPEFLTRLVRLMQHPDATAREAAAAAAEWLGPDAATPAVLDALTLLQADPEYRVRYHADAALHALRPGK